MATRRARIKAVTALPPRRKNNEAADNVKAKITEKDITEKPLKSPRTPRGFNRSQENLERNSPKPASPLRSPRFISNEIRAGRVPSPAATTVVNKDVGTPKKVSVITSTNSVKSNVFVSPKSVGSPLKRAAASPLPQSTRTEVNIQRIPPQTPDKQPETPKLQRLEQKSNENEKSITTNKTIKLATPTSVTSDYNTPSASASERVTEDTVMDGIIPLQPVSNAPKPLALLKNEIISENAEVLFDPIVPLPSPSKVRPKLRPVPRLMPLRRNSVQGSASESEDESRRALLSGGTNTPAPPRQRHDSHTSHSTMHSLPNREVNRNRNDSVCSSVSQIAAQPPTASSPVKEKQTKSRRTDMSRRNAAMRRRHESIERDKLTMYDLIFYNPSSNPIIPDQDELKAKEANEKQEAERKAKKEEDETSQSSSKDAAPVPQIKLGPNGEIILDEESLVIKQSDTRKVASGVVHEGAWGGTMSGRYRRTARTAEWNDAETVRFYRALAALGTDFMLMEKLFPGRTRRDLKLKFKKEERVNMAQVDKALRTSVKWDAMKLAEEFEEERAAAERRAQAEVENMRLRAKEQLHRQRSARHLRVRMSRSSKALDGSILPATAHSKDKDILTADDVIQRYQETKARKRKPRALPVDAPPKPPKPIRPKTTQQEPEHFASLTLMTHNATTQDKKDNSTEMASMATIVPTKSVTPNLVPVTPQSTVTPPQVPPNIENGSLVVLTVDDPKSPSKKMLQTYIASGGRLTPISLSSSFLTSVMSYMKKGTPKSNMSAGSSPHLTSPSSVASQDSRSCSTPGVIQGVSPKRQRHSSYTITQL